jgi:hypothetical protein
MTTRLVREVLVVVLVVVVVPKLVAREHLDKDLQGHQVILELMAAAVAAVVGL